MEESISDKDVLHEPESKDGDQVNQIVPKIKLITANISESGDVLNEDCFQINDHIIYNFFTPEKADELSKRANKLRCQEREFEQRFSQKLVRHIKVEDVNNGGSPSRRKKINNGSLYSMFHSDFFDINMMIIYLDKKEEVGIVDMLVNIMYDKFINESFFYLPQLCTFFSYKGYTNSLENYILDRCINQMKFSLQATWLITSYIDQEGNKKTSEKYQSLLQKIEETMVNGSRSTLSKYSQYNREYMRKTNESSKTVQWESSVLKKACEKELRLTYFDRCITFYEDLKTMCEKLKAYPKEALQKGGETRASVMREHLKNFNKELEALRAEVNIDNCNSNTAVSNFYMGFILPFDDSLSTLDSDNSLIVRFIPQYSFCFSTKARVPTKICCECIRVGDCENWKKLYIATDQENSCEQLPPKESNPVLLRNPLLLSPIKMHPLMKKKTLSEFYFEIQEKKISNLNLNDSAKTDIATVNVTSTISPESDSNKQSTEEKPATVNPFGKKWSIVAEEIKATSPFRQFYSYSTKNFIAKANDDLRQELLAMQLIKEFQMIFSQADMKLNLHPYEILITSSSSGLIEFLPNTNSIDGIKKQLPAEWNLNTFYRSFFQDNFDNAQRNFAESLAGYSIVSYYLQIKDRHNGNILIDMNGRIIHIDFGFILGINPGNINFENAPFKLTKEYVEILDGPESEMFEYYKTLMTIGMIECKKHVEPLVKIVEVMSRGSKMPCFEEEEISVVIAKFRERFNEAKSDLEFRKIVNDLIEGSYNNFWTNKYDYYQKLTNGICY